MMRQKEERQKRAEGKCNFSCISDLNIQHGLCVLIGCDVSGSRLSALSMLSQLFLQHPMRQM